MKADAKAIERALDAPSPDFRLFLLHGPDEAGSRALAERLERAMGADAERIDLDGSAVAKDPARLADEAAAISLFGSKRHIRLRVSADEAVDAIETLLGAEAAGNPVVALAGALRGSSKLLKLALAAPNALAFASYVPEGRNAEALAMTLAHEAGLRMAADVARRLVAATGGDRALLAREIEKLALFIDAAPDRPGEVDAHALDAIGADAGEPDTARLVDAVFGGAPAEAVDELARLDGSGVDPNRLLFPLRQRLTLLTRLRADVDGGESLDGVMASAGRSLFWKDKAPVTRQLRLWPSDRLATAHARLLDAERQLRSPASIGAAALQSELVAIARAAARGR